uniref:THAP-type domain-containing protein n=1 Tax=Gouania willdenowi TaxID=441366 RepID=A0A8C5NBG6_GOUWI
FIPALLSISGRWWTQNDSSMLCSEHFKPDHFDRTGQIVRLRDCVTPSVFNFPCNLQRRVFLLYIGFSDATVRKYVFAPLMLMEASRSSSVTFLRSLISYSLVIDGLLFRD